MGCTIENYDIRIPGTNDSLVNARVESQKFVDGYPVTTGRGRGLMFTGSVGLGKTHLAVGILHALVLEKGVDGLFCSYRELLKEIQNSYSRSMVQTETELLRPVLDAEVLVIDELGAARATEWVFDTVALILNTRYNKRRTTIVTTNLADRPPAGPISNGFTDREIREQSERVARPDTLGDRIGEPMRSRLASMCKTIEMHGSDYRQGEGRVRFG